MENKKPNFANNKTLTIKTMDPSIVVYDYMDTFFCCMVEKDKWCEEMVSEHMLVYLCSGELDLIAPDKKYHLKKAIRFLLNATIWCEKSNSRRKMVNRSKDCSYN